MTESRIWTAMAALLIWSLVSASLPAQIAGSPTLVVGNDLAELREAAAKNDDNIGMKMRIVRALLIRVRDSVRISETERLYNELESVMADMVKREPRFPYPYRVLSQIQYRKQKYAKVLDVLDAYRKHSPLDANMRSLYVRTLLRRAGTSEKYATMVDDGEVVKIDKKPINKTAAQHRSEASAFKKEAAQYVGEWFDSGDAPGFGATLGSCAAWIHHDTNFRDELLRVFKTRHEANPKNLNLIISYSALLSALGRNESAWNLIHDAEKIGLCDTLTGTRHPVSHILEWSCPEFGGDQVVASSTLENLEAKMNEFPNNASLPLRAALVAKGRGDAAYQLEAIFRKQRKDFIKEKDPEAATKAPKWAKKADEFREEGKKYYRRALPFAEKAYALNKEADAVVLLLGDINFQLDQFDTSIRYFKEGVERVPDFADLRQGLARVYEAKKDWRNAALEMVEVCRDVPCDAVRWDDEAEDSLVPLPQNSREDFLKNMAENAESRGVFISTFEQAAKNGPANPNLNTYVAVLHFFAGNKKESSRWMLAAEAAGICGEGGDEHILAQFILNRSW